VCGGGEVRTERPLHQQLRGDDGGHEVGQKKEGIYFEILISCVFLIFGLVWCR